MCKRVNSKEPIMLKYYPDRCNMCDKAVNTCLPKLKYVLDWLDFSQWNDWNN